MTVKGVLDHYNITLEDVNKVICDTVTKTIMADLLYGSAVSFNEASNVYKAAVIIKSNRKE